VLYSRLEPIELLVVDGGQTTCKLGLLFLLLEICYNESKPDG
jgi:hypothetical protein